MFPRLVRGLVFRLSCLALDYFGGRKEAIAFHSRALGYIRSGFYSISERWSIWAIMSDRSYFGGYTSLARTYYLNGQYELAERTLQQGRRMCGDEAPLLIELADLYKLTE